MLVKGVIFLGYSMRLPSDKEQLAANKYIYSNGYLVSTPSECHNVMLMSTTQLDNNLCNIKILISI